MTQRIRPAPDASMTLLKEVMQRPLDPGYAAAAEQKRSLKLQGKAADTPLLRVGALVLAVLLGFTTITAVLSLRSRSEVTDGARALLREQIVVRTSEMNDLEVQIKSLSEEARVLQESLLSDTSGQMTDVQRRDATLNGTMRVSGPGLVVTLADGPNTVDDRDNRVRDVDVRGVVSALWSVGAEAISVNGKRLTPTSAIRSAGDAILVDLAGLSGPYVIEAIGDPDVMEVGFVRHPITHDLLELEKRYGIGTEVEKSQHLELSSGTSKDLLHARAEAN